MSAEVGTAVGCAVGEDDDVVVVGRSKDCNASNKSSNVAWSIVVGSSSF